MSDSALVPVSRLTRRGFLQLSVALVETDMACDAQTVYRTNTYPFVHLGFIHMVLNVLALTPMLERFESEYGTLTSLALFMGRKFRSSQPTNWCKHRIDQPFLSKTAFSTFPAGLYVLSQKFILHSNTAVMGASVWFFLLLGMEAIRTYKTNPHFTIATYNIPTWITPLFLIVVTSALVPSSSLLGHVCGLVVGYFCMFRTFLTLFDQTDVCWLTDQLRS